MPESLHGNELAIGYSALKRDGERDKVELFHAMGITPAAGFSSSVEDLGKFASWQFRLLETDEQEILNSSTLDYMHRVHWTDPDWETTWGLGFSIGRSSSGETVVGHGGSCPGYRSSLVIEPKNKMACSVMINAGGTNPSKYANGIRGIMKKMEKSGKSDDQKSADSEDEKFEFSHYTGYYYAQPWSGEVFRMKRHGNYADKIIKP
jgi:CubicO group peptidase (beta-lactamase class C family)